MTGVFKFPEYEQHPIAVGLMPGGMDDQEFEAFTDDITQRGVLMPITLFENKVLDGWHRYRAAKKAQCAFKETVYTGKDPAGYVASVNVMRRKLSSLQRALVGARLHRDHGLTQREACRRLGISNEVVTLVLKAMDSKNAKLLKRIENDGDFSRGMLKEELEELGVRPKKDAPPPAGPNSVFDAGKMPTLSDAAATIPGQEGDTDGIGDDDPIPDTGKKNPHKERKPTKTAAQLLSEEFKALTVDEKQSFLTLIEPAIRAMRKDGYKIGCDPAAPDVKLGIAKVTKKDVAAAKKAVDDMLAPKTKKGAKK